MQDIAVDDDVVEVGVITCSDDVDFISDDVGQTLIELCEARGWRVIAYEVVPLERMFVSSAILRFIDDVVVDAIFTCGGVGSAAEDVVPSATSDISEGDPVCVLDALQAMRETIERASGATFDGTATRHGRTVVVNLPYSESAIRESFESIADALMEDIRPGAAEPSA